MAAGRISFGHYGNLRCCLNLILVYLRFAGTQASASAIICEVPCGGSKKPRNLKTRNRGKYNCALWFMKSCALTSQARQKPYNHCINTANCHTACGPSSEVIR